MTYDRAWITYAEEKRIKDAAKAKRSRKYIYEPVGLDLWDPTRKTHRPLKRGDVVVKIQPHGCPRNGTMGHCYVGDPDTGAFIGLVLENSLRLA